jgi:monovalent cation:H+ antiporter-2, CPA2 family
MDGYDLIQDLAIALLAAGLAGALCKRAGLSVVVGYLIAGIIIGPHTPPFSFIMDVERIQTLSQIGLVFLMFAIGLGLSLSRLAKMGVATLIATALGAFLVFNLTRLLGQAVGWTPVQSLFIASMFMVSSSAVIAKMIGELGLSHERPAQIALTITVLEDVVAVVMLTILANQTPQGSSGGTNMVGLLGGLTAFVVLLVGVGLLIVPRVMRRLEKRADPELQTIIVAGLLFVLALAAAKAGYSLALGAFLLGAIVAEIPQKAAVENAFSGLRDMFSSVFFVSIGMMIDVRMLGHVWLAAIGLAVFALAARSICAGLALILVGNAPREARRAALLLTPLGEFSFIIALTGVHAQILPREYYPLAVGVSVLTVLISPLINRHAERILDLVERFEPARVRRTLDAYHGWVRQIQERPAPPLAWNLVQSRLVQIAFEMLFVSGLLIFSRPLIELGSSFLPDQWTAHPVMTYLPWSVLVIIVLIPFVAIWRNISAIALIAAESLANGRLTPRLIENGVRATAALVLAYWLYLVLPITAMSDWGWIALAAAAAVLATFFSNRLIYWHSQWHSSVREVLATPSGGRAEERSNNRAQLSRNLGEWDIHLAECTLPEGAAHAGKTLGELAIPRTFGSSVVEVERNGYVIASPGPDFAISTGDKLLLMGQPEQIKRTAAFLQAAHATDQTPEMGDSILDTCLVADSPRAGQTLGSLEVTKHTGVRIVGIDRDGVRITNPTARDQLQNGDRVLVLGSLPQIAEFRRWLRDANTATAAGI